MPVITYVGRYAAPLFGWLLTGWLTLGLLLALPFSVRAQGTEICNNGIDDDGDRLVDCQDPDCPECPRFESCVQPNTCYLPPIWGVPNGGGVSVYGSQDLVLSTNAPFTTVTIRTADGSYVNTVGVTPSASTIVTLPLSVVMSNLANTKQTNAGLILTSSEPVQATYRLTASNNQDIIPLKCRAALGYAFYAGSQTRVSGNNIPNERHFVGIMAVLDGTTVTIRSPIDLEGIPANTTHTVTLNAGQTYMVTSRLINAGANSENKSLAGTLITSDPDHPIVVNSGSQHMVQPYSGNRDAGLEQLVPARTTGTDYVAVKGANTTANSDYIYVVGIEDNTGVTVTGPTTTAGASSVLTTTTLNDGQVFTYNLPNGAQNRAFYIKTTKRAYVFHVSSYAQNEFGMGMLPTINPCNGSRRIEFYRTSASSADQALVTIPSSGTASLTFRGQSIAAAGGTVVDRITIDGVPHSIVSFPNSAIAAGGAVNTITSTERFHVGVVSNTGGGSTGNYGYYSNYEASVDVINPQTGQPDDFYTVGEVTLGSPVNYCLTLTSCGTTNSIKSIARGRYTQSATINGQQCITYTMSTTAPICARDTIRAIVQNELGRESQVCLEFVNRNNDLIVSVLNSSSVICQPGGTTSLTVVAVSSARNYNFQWITPDKQVLSTSVVTGATPGRYLISVGDGNRCIDTTSIVLRADTPALRFTGASASSTSFCAGATVPYTLSATAGTVAWSVTSGTIVSGGSPGTPGNPSATVRWGGPGSGTLRAVVTSPDGCTAAVTQTVQLQAAPVLSFSVQNPACFGQASGTVNLTPTGSTTPYSYTWSNGATTEDLTNVVSGAYSVTVADRGGCRTSGSATVGQPTAVTVTPTITNASCNGRNTGAVSLTVSGGTPGGLPSYRYSWNTGATTPGLTSVAAGTYTVTVTDANNCATIRSLTITQPPAISLAITQQNVFCNGGNTGSINLTPSGGTGAYTYRWAGPANNGATIVATQDLASLQAGTYSVTVTDANSCTVTTTVTITQPPALAVATTSQNPTCNGASDGQVDLTPTGGVSTYTYRWTTGATTQDLTNVPAGTYSVTVTDANQCTAIASVTLVQPAALSLTPSQQDVGCFGGTNGSLTLSPAGGLSPYTYRWDNSSTANSRSGLAAGIYSVTLTDANQCALSQSFTIAQPAALSLTTIRQNPTCNAATTGQIDLSVTGGTQPFQYAWTGPGATGTATQDIANVGAGTFGVTVTDANNCVATLPVSLTQPAALLPNLTKQDVACNGAATGQINLAPTGGTGAYTYRWTTGATSQNLPNVPAGPYSVTIADANGCTATANTTLSQPPAITLTTATQNPLCAGTANGSIDLTVAGGTLPYTYTWASGANTQDVSALVAGLYSVTVADGNGCRATLATTLTNPPALSLTATPRNPGCFGAATGQISTTATGGTGSYTYRWTTGATTPGLTNVLAGPYSVTVTDANGCSLVRSYTLTNPPVLSLTANSQNPACFGAATGSINLTATGGTGAYTYLWTTGATTQNLTNVGAGTYRVIVTDANGCSQTLITTLTNPPALSLGFTKENPACFGASTGSVSLTASGGTGAYTYGWTTGATTPTLSNVPAGPYSVSVTDANGCAAIASTTLTQPPALTLTATAQPTGCFGSNDGAVNLAVQGGTGAYTYLWSNNATTQNLSNVPSEPYSVTVTDANGCQGVRSVTVVQPTALSLTATTEQIACFGGNTGRIDVTPSGGTFGPASRPYTYRWTTGDQTQDLTNVPIGTYSLTVTDANSCTISLSRSLTQPTALAATESHTNVSCFGGNNGRIELSPSGGVSPYMYLWSNGATSPAISGLTSNTYTVTITDANGCTFGLSVPITQPLPLTVIPQPSDVLCNGQFASIVTDTRGGTAPYTYLWSNGATTPSVVNLPAGSYSLVVTDANGCTATTAATIVQPAPFGIAASVTAVACNQGETGAIQLTVEGATPPYAFTITNAANMTVVGSTTLTTGLKAGTYLIGITDNNGCVQSLSVNIGEPPAITLTTTTINVLCFGNQTGQLSLTATGGREPFAFNWQDGVTTQNRTSLMAGAYSVTLTDANGCTATTATSVTQPPLLTLGTSFTNILCTGNNTGSVTANPAGGTVGPASRPYTYLWSTGAQTPTLASLQAGVYSVTVTDANGCRNEAPVVLDEPTALTATLIPQNLTCFQNSTGEITSSISGGTAPYTYVWENGLTTPNRTELAAGVYSVTITDANGCSQVRSATLTQPAADDLISTVVEPRCFGDATGSISLTLLGGTLPRSFTWSDGAQTQNRTGLRAGTYSVSIEDANGCPLTESFTLTEPTALTSAISSVSVGCFSTTTGSISLSASGGSPGTPDRSYSYTWADGVQTPNRPGLAAGTYQVRIRDANGCETSNTVTLTEPPALVVNLTPSPARCSGSSSGSIVSSVSGGTSGTPDRPYTYQWNTGFQTNFLAGLSAGIYSLTVTDANGCFASESTTVTQPTTMTVSGSQTNIACFGGNNGQANVAAAGGSSPYTYAWATGETVSSINSLVAGTYSVSVTDANGCFEVQSFTLTQPSAVSVAVLGTNIGCFGGNTGTVLATATGGVGPYTYRWSGSELGFGASVETQYLASLQAGTYSVTATDANGCSAQNSLTLTEPTALTGTIAGTNLSCFGGADGTISTTIVGGTVGPASRPYSYTWADAALTTPTRTGLPVGTYTVNVADANGCRFSLTQSLTQPAAVAVALSTTAARCNGATDGAISATASGGTGPYTYRWNGPANTTATTAELTGIRTGTYSITVTDANGCTVSSSATVGQPTSLSLSGQRTNLICFGGTNGQATVEAAGGTLPYAYQWTSGAQTASVASLTAGVYSVTVADANGCFEIQSFTLTQPTAVSVAVSGTNIGCFGGNTGVVSLTATGGTSGTPDRPYTYLWTTPTGTGATTADVSELIAGTYSVTATDANGCSGQNSLTLTEPTALTANASATNVSCNGGTNGTISLTVTGGTFGPASRPYSYLWGDGATVSDRTSLTAGTYQVIVTDANGCQQVVARTITQPDPLRAQLAASAISCNAGADGSLSVVVSGGTFGPASRPYAYLWSNGVSTSVATGLVAGTYSVTVADANGCSQVLSETLTQPGALTLVGTTMPAVCIGEANGAASLIVTGGTPLYNYQWSGPTAITATTPDVSSLVAGTYSVTVTDANGCAAQTSLTVAEPQPLLVQGVATAPNCAGPAPRPDGQLRLTTFDPTWRYALIEGPTFTDTITAPGSLPTIPPNGVLANNLLNPASALGLTYTIRVFTPSGCFADLTLTLPQAACSCKPEPICAPVVLRKTR